MEIQRSRRIGALAVSCDAYPVIDQKLLHSRDFLRIYQGRAGEEKVVRPADFLKFQFLLLHKGAAEHLVPGPVVEGVENVIREVMIVEDLFFRKVLFPHGRVFIGKKLKIFVPAAHLADREICLCLIQSFRLLFEKARLKEIIGIEEGEILSLRRLHAMVSGRSAAGIFLLQQVKTAVLFHIFADDFHRIVCGTVIHAKHLKIL